MTSPIETDIVSAALRVDVVRRRGGGGRPRGKSKTTTASASAPGPTPSSVRPSVGKRSTHAKSAASSRPVSAAAAAAKKKSDARATTTAPPPPPPSSPSAARENPLTDRVGSAPARRKPKVDANEAVRSRVPAASSPDDSTTANVRLSPPPPSPPLLTTLVAPPSSQPSPDVVRSLAASRANDVRHRAVATPASRPTDASQPQLGSNGRTLPPVPLYASHTMPHVPVDAPAPIVRPPSAALFSASASASLPSPAVALPPPPPPIIAAPVPSPSPPSASPPDPLIASALFGADAKEPESNRPLPLDVRTLMAFRHITPFTPARVHRELQTAQFASVVWRDSLQQRLLRGWPMASRTMPALAWRDRSEEGRHAYAGVASQLAQLDPRNDWSPALLLSSSSSAATASASASPPPHLLPPPPPPPSWSSSPSSSSLLRPTPLVPAPSPSPLRVRPVDTPAAQKTLRHDESGASNAARDGATGSTATRRNTGASRLASLAPPPMPPPFRRETHADSSAAVANATGRGKQAATEKTRTRRRRAATPVPGEKTATNGGKRPKTTTTTAAAATVKRGPAKFNDSGSGDGNDRRTHKTSRTDTLPLAPHPIVGALAAESEPTREQWRGVDVARVARALDDAGRAHRVTNATADAAKLVCVALRQLLERVWRGARAAAEARADMHRRDTDTVVRADPRRMLQEARAAETRRAERRRTEVVAAARAARDAELLRLAPSPRPVDSPHSGRTVAPAAAATAATTTTTAASSVASPSAFAKPPPPPPPPSPSLSQLSPSASTGTPEKNRRKRGRRDSSTGGVVAGVGAAEQKRARLERAATSRLSDEHRRALEAEREREMRVARNRSVHAALGVTPTSFAALQAARSVPAASEKTAAIDSKQGSSGDNRSASVSSLAATATATAVAPALVRLAHDADGWSSDDDSDSESGVPRRPIGWRPPPLWGRVSEPSDMRPTVEARDTDDAADDATHGDAGRGATEFPTERAEAVESDDAMVSHVSESVAAPPPPPTERLSSDAGPPLALMQSRPSSPPPLAAKKPRAAGVWGVLERRDPREFSKRASELRVTALDLVRYLESDVRFRHSLRLEKARHLLALSSAS